METARVLSLHRLWCGDGKGDGAVIWCDERGFSVPEMCESSWGFVLLLDGDRGPVREEAGLMIWGGGSTNG